MDITASGTGTAAAAEVATSIAARGWPAASCVLAGAAISLVGLSWDAQWHADVGPDTFFTLPHLFLYSGSAIAGVVSLAVVLVATAAAHRGRRLDALVGGPPVRVLGGAFAAPLGYLVSGAGAALFLLYGLWDLWWHGLYGFDAVLESPPHIGLLLSIMLTMVGSVTVFAAAGRRPWGTPGLVLGTAVLMAFSAVPVIAMAEYVGGTYAAAAGTALLSAAPLLTAASLHRNAGTALAIAVTLNAIQAALWWFSPWAAHAYADGVGLPVRDFIEAVPAIPSLIPMGIVAAAVTIEVILWLGRHRARPPRALAALAGATAGALIATLGPLQDHLLHGADIPATASMVAVAATGAAAGLLAGLLGLRVGAMLRHLAPEQAR